MTKLSLMDQVFYKLETGGISPVYMGGGMILDPGDSPYPLDGKSLADHLAACLEQVPVLRQKLVQDRLRIGDMRLVDDPEFDIRNHITRTVLEAPGGPRELNEYFCEFSAQRLDLSRPLWHFEVIEGLEGGQLAFASHLHHSLMDGMGAMAVLGGLWDSEPLPAEQPTDPAWAAEDEPTPFELLREALRENAERMYTKTPALLRKSGGPVLKAGLNALLDNLKTRLNASESTRDIVTVPKVRKTSINVDRLSSRRVISRVNLPLDQVKALRRHYDCSINDLAILFNSYALQHYFETIGEAIDFDLVTGIAINTRRKGDHSLGNSVTPARLSLHNRITDIEERLRAIVHDTTLIKSAANREGGSEGDRASPLDGKELMGLFSPVVLDALVYGVVKFNLLSKVSLLNTCITNVPGSGLPMYIAGARLVGMVPMAPVFDSVGLTITVSSTDEHLVMGYHGCGEAIQDAELFVQGARNGFEALAKAAGMRGKPGKKPLGVRKKAPSAASTKKKAVTRKPKATTSRKQKQKTSKGRVR